MPAFESSRSAPPATGGAATREQAPTESTTVGTRLLRILLIGGVCALGWYTLTTFAGLLSGPQPVRLPEPPRADPNAVVSLPAALQALPAPGPWVFAGQPWQVRVAQLPDRERRERFQAPPAPTVQGAEPSEGERGLLSLVKLMGGTPHRRGRETTYVVTQPDFEAVLFTLRHGDQERVLAGRMIHASGPDQWTLVEVVPATTQTGPATRDGESPMPLPAGTQRLAARQDERGVVLCEVATVALDLAQVRDYWQQHGWSVQSFPGGDAHGSPLYCEKGAQAVQVWARAADPKTKRLVLIMIRLMSNPARPEPARAVE